MPNYKSIVTIALLINLSACGSTPDKDSSILLAADDMFPEGIGLADDGTAYIGSLARSEIWQVNTGGGDASLFAGIEADLMSVLGVHVSNDGTLVYACSSDPAQKFNGRITELVSFDRATGSVYARYALPGGGLCNDITELPDGTILATDSVASRILALTPDGNSSTWLEDESFKVEGFGLNGIATINNTVYVGVFATGKLYRILTVDDTVVVDLISLDRLLAGPDGIEFLANGDLLVVEGETASLPRIKLDDTGLVGITETVAEGLEAPTTVAADGNKAFVVQGQLGRFFGMDPSPVVPFEVSVIRLE